MDIAINTLKEKFVEGFLNTLSKEKQNTLCWEENLAYQKGVKKREVQPDTNIHCSETMVHLLGEIIDELNSCILVIHEYHALGLWSCVSMSTKKLQNLSWWENAIFQHKNRYGTPFVENYTWEDIKIDLLLKVLWHKPIDSQILKIYIQ